MKVAELTGAQLDYWVARAEGWDGSKAAFHALADYAPSTNWAHGGPLIDKYPIALEHSNYPTDGTHYAYVLGKEFVGQFGSTPLQAICRAVVRAAFGDEVPGLAEGGA